MIAPTPDSTRLSQELEAAGIPIHGCCRHTGRIDFRAEATREQREAAAAILAAFNPSDTPDQKVAKLNVPLRLLAALTQIASKGRANAPAWARNTADGFAAKIDEVLAP